VPLPGGGYTDAATLLEFSGATAIPNKETLLSATSYGTGEFATCKGQLFGIVFYPLRINWEPPNLVPNPFSVEMYLFNPQTVQGAPNTKVTLTVGTDLTIISPSPITHNGKRQKQDVQVGAYIPPLGIGIASWSVQASKSTQCNSDILSSLRFAAESPGLGYPIFVNDVDGSDTVEHPVIIECAGVDQLPPIAEGFSLQDIRKRYLDFRDNRITDKGLKSVTWTPKPGTDTNDFFIKLLPTLIPCSKDTHNLSMHRYDSSKSGCFDIRAEDCAGNIFDTTICYIGIKPPDIVAPKVFDDTAVDLRTAYFIMTDTSEIDTGISHITITPPFFGTVTQTIEPPLTPCSKLVHQVMIRRSDSLHTECIKYTITDCAGNATVDSICFVGTLGINSEAPGRTFSLLGNPSSDRATVQLTLDRAHDVTLRIVDAVGREVRRIDVKGLSIGENLIPIQTSKFASGTYYVVVEIDGKQFAKSLKVVR
jgi:hypothetical protein